MAKVTARTCPRCGAPLSVRTGVSDVNCEYCGTLVHVEWGRRPALPVPTRVETPVVYVPPPKPGWVLALIGLRFLLPIGWGVAAFVGGGGTGPRATTVATLGVKPGLPATCRDTLTLDKQKFDGPGPAVTLLSGCKLRIMNSTLRGDIVIAGGDSSEVTIESSTLVGQDAAVRLGMNSKLYLTGKSVLRAHKVTVAMGANSQVSLDHSTVESDEIGVQADTNFKLSGTQSTISGGTFGVVGVNNVAIEGDALSLRSRGVGLEMWANLRLTMRGGSIEGDKVGIRQKDANASVSLTRSAKILGRETALEANANLKLEAGEATLIGGGQVGVRAGANPKLDVSPGARIEGRRAALIAGANLKLQLNDGTLDSETVAICAPSNVAIQARGGVIRGGVDAFRFESRPRTLSLVGTTITGAQRFNVRSCGVPR